MPLRRLAAVALALLLAAPLALLVAGQAGALRGTAPPDLGVREGRLKPPSPTPNSVSSQAALWPDHPLREQAAIAPLGTPGQAAATLDALRRVLATWPGATVAVDRPDYLQVSFETRWLRFVDDAEFWADPATGVVQLRSASRLGRRDFDVNRNRMEALRAALAASAASVPATR